MFLVPILTLVSFFLVSVLADLSCHQFVPHGSKGNVGIVNFLGQGKLHYIPSTNATIGYNVQLLQGRPGTTFHFQVCKSTSLNFSSSVDPYCYDEGCSKNYINNIRVLNPESGHCLTSRPAANGLLALTPELCNGNPTTTSQIFQTFQFVTYSYGFKQLLSYGSVNFLPYGYAAAFVPTNEYDPWVVGGDNKTLFYNPPPDGSTFDSLAGNIVITSGK